MLSAIIAIIGGIIAASSFIIAKKPDAKELIDKLTPYQGWIGVILTFFGVWGIINSLGHFSILGIATAAITFIVGFLLGYGLISKYLLEKNEDAKAKGQELRMKLVKYQVPAGLSLIVLGVLTLLQILRIL